MSTPSWHHLTVAPWSSQDDGEEGRIKRGAIIALTTPIIETPLGFQIPSQSGNGTYIVRPGADFWCSCPDFAERRDRCKHIFAVDLFVDREIGQDDFAGLWESWHGANGVTDSAQATNTAEDTSHAVINAQPLNMEAHPQLVGYKRPPIVGADCPLSEGHSKDGRNWPAYNAAQCNEGRHFRILLRALCSTIEESPQLGRGRPRLPLRELVYNAALATYTTQSGRRATNARVDAAELGLVDWVPSHATIARHVNTPALTPVLQDLIQKSATPYRSMERMFAVDSTGVSTNVNDVDWNTRKHGNGKRTKNTVWTKLHIMIGVKSHIITAAYATESEVGDSVVYEPLLNDTAKWFPTIEGVCADKAYLSRYNIKVTDEVGGYLYVPFKVNSVVSYQQDTLGQLWNRALYFFGHHQDKFLELYHQRSQVETSMWMVKSKFMAYGRAKAVDARRNEILLKVLCHNLCAIINDIYEVGLQPSFLDSVGFQPSLMDDAQGDDGGVATPKKRSRSFPPHSRRNVSRR